MCGKNKPLPKARRCRKCQTIVNERQRVRRAETQAAGLCKCGRAPPEPSRVDCRLCIDAYTKSRNVTRARRVKEGLCVCGKPPRSGRRSCTKCSQKWQLRHANDRKKCLEHYGLVCACPGCNCNIEEFLEIDHIDGNGNEHRRTFKTSIYRWLIKHKFPPGFQVLCSNCNRAKFRYGSCPHTRRP